MIDGPATGPNSKPSRLNDGERAAAKRRLALWASPEAFTLELERLRAELREYFFVQSGIEFLRDAHCAAAFARLRCATEVRLTPPEIERPDFEFRSGTAVTAVEVTEAMKTGRLRSDEYKVAVGEKTYTQSSAGEPELTLAELSHALADSVRKKASIPYPPETLLLIYVNRPTGLSDFTEQDRITLAAAIHAVQHSFQEIWLLGGVGALRIEPGPLVQINDPITNPAPDPHYKPTPLSGIPRAVR